jgi:hypothetical protein
MSAGRVLPHAPSHKGTSSQNSPLLRDLLRRGRKPQLPYVDAKAAVSFRFVLVIYARLFAVQIEPELFLEMPPV